MSIMWTWHQIFVVSGLFLEIASVVYGIIITNNFFKSKQPKFDKKSNMWILKKIKMRRPIGDDQKKPIKDQIADTMKNWLFAFIFLVTGVILQAIAEFV